MSRPVAMLHRCAAYLATLKTIAKTVPKLGEDCGDCKKHLKMCVLDSFTTAVIYSHSFLRLLARQRCYQCRHCSTHHSFANGLKGDNSCLVVIHRHPDGSGLFANRSIKFVDETILNNYSGRRKKISKETEASLCEY